MSLPSDPLATLASTTYRRLRQGIIKAEFAPGSKLKIRALCDHFGVGLSPMREALSRLSSEGLVRQSDQRGFSVTDISESDLQDLINARCWLNELGLRKSIEQGDADWEERVLLAFHRLSRLPRLLKDPGERSPEWQHAHAVFHRTLISASGSSRLTGFCDQLFDGADRYRYFARLAGQERSNVEEEHEAIMRAALARDADRAVDLLNRHFMRTADLVRRVLAERLLANRAKLAGTALRAKSNSRKSKAKDSFQTT
jgi:DNA-binding GntR family transcriptional regulator